MKRRAGWTAALHRRLPARSAGWLARAAARRDARNPQAMERARASMQLLLDQAQPDADLEELSRRYLMQVRWQNAARWHAELSRPLPVRGLDRLTSVDGGVLVHIVHHGPFLLIGPSLAQSGREVHVVADPGLCAPDRKPWQAQSHWVASQGCHLFSAEEGAAGVRDRLARGLVVAAATDVPGHTPVTFLGQKLVGSSGAVRVAHTSGTPVISASVHRDEEGRPHYRLSEPLDPADFDSVEALLQELLARQEPAVLAWPEAYYDPLTKWHQETPEPA
jgi:lauroyl/myristoyl acyltransferase